MGEKAGVFYADGLGHGGGKKGEFRVIGRGRGV